MNVRKNFVTYNAENGYLAYHFAAGGVSSDRVDCKQLKSTITKMQVEHPRVKCDDLSVIDILEIRGANAYASMALASEFPEVQIISMSIRKPGRSAYRGSPLFNVKEISFLEKSLNMYRKTIDVLLPNVSLVYTGQNDSLNLIPQQIANRVKCLYVDTWHDWVEARGSVMYANVDEFICHVMTKDTFEILQTRVGIPNSIHIEDAQVWPTGDFFSYMIRHPHVRLPSNNNCTYHLRLADIIERTRVFYRCCGKRLPNELKLVVCMCITR
jgi:hypothetical protein